MALPGVAVVSRIVPDEALGRWEIQDLSRFQRRSSKAYSSGPILVAGCSPFGLLLRLGGKDTEFASDLQVYAVNLSGKRTMGQHTIRVVNQARGRESDVVLMGEPGLWDSKSEWGWKQAMSLETLEDSEAGFVIDDTLVLELYMQVWEPEAIRTQGSPATLARCCTPLAVPPPSLAGDLGELLRSGRGSDITVRAAGLSSGPAGDSNCCSGAGCSGAGPRDMDSSGGSSCSCCSAGPPIRAHRLVLAARSPVLERLLFSSGMRETTDAGYELRLEGADAKVAVWFVRFLYTDEVAHEAWEDQEGLCYLLTVAHRYQVQPLVERCQFRLVEQLSEERAPERLMMADLLDSPALKFAVLDYICGSHRRLARIQASDGFERLTRTRPGLLRDILATVVPPAPKRPKTQLDASNAD